MSSVLEAAETMTSLSDVEKCCICGETESKNLCRFPATDKYPEKVQVHVFCGKTAAFLPKTNLPELEILSRQGIRNKFGHGPLVTQLFRTVRHATVKVGENNEVYFFTKEFADALAELKDTLALLYPVGASLHPVKEVKIQRKRAKKKCSTNAPTALTSPTAVVPIDTSVATTVTPESEHQAASPPKKKINYTQSPYQVTMDHLTDVCGRVGGIAYHLVRGVAPAQSEQDYAETDPALFDPQKCSQYQVDYIRIIILTSHRQYQFKLMDELVAAENGPDESSGVTPSCEQVLRAWKAFQELYKDAKHCALQFDLLLGFTAALHKHNGWMHDRPHEYGMDVILTQIALSWNDILQKTDELSIDDDFTLPGVLCLLQEFQHSVETVAQHLEFKYWEENK